MDDETLNAIAELLAQRLKASATSPTVTPPHGPDSTFNTPGLSRNIVNALVQPMPGLWGFLEQQGHVFRSADTSPIFGILTAQTASSGSEPTVACAPGRTPGNLTMCQISFPFGQLTMSSSVIRLQDAGQVINRGELVDQRLIGNPFADLPPIASVTPQQLFLSRYAKAVVELLNAIRRDYQPLVFTGNPTNTSASNNYKEYNGLAKIFNTGYRDAITGQLCPAADPLVVTSLAGKNVASNAEEYVSTIVEAYTDRVYLSRQLSLGDVQWAFVGKRGFFRALTEVWACTYRTYRCDLTANPEARVNLDGNAMTQQVLDMRNNSYLLIDDVRVPFIPDDALPEDFVNNSLAGGGLWESDLYLVPLRASSFVGDEYGPAGQITYINNFDYGAPGAAESIISAAGWQSYARVTNDKRFLLLNEPPTNGCFQLQVYTRPRIICRAPFLGIRFPDVRFQKRFNERSPFPGNPYNIGGGAYSFAGQTIQTSVP